MELLIEAVCVVCESRDYLDPSLPYAKELERLGWEDGGDGPVCPDCLVDYIAGRVFAICADLRL